MRRTTRRDEPLERLVAMLHDDGAEADERQATTTFLRGLTLGAIVGAAIAGSTIWSRWRRDRAASVRDSSAGDAQDGLG